MWEKKTHFRSGRSRWEEKPLFIEGKGSRPLSEKTMVSANDDLHSARSGPRQGASRGRYAIKKKRLSTKGLLGERGPFGGWSLPRSSNVDQVDGREILLYRKMGARNGGEAAGPPYLFQRVGIEETYLGRSMPRNLQKILATWSVSTKSSRSYRGRGGKGLLRET